MKVYYSDKLTIPLPDGHRFPVTKYRMLRDRLIAAGVLREDEIIASPLATHADVLLAHTAEYVDGIFNGTVNPQIMKRIGFPWSEGLVARSLATVGGYAKPIDLTVEAHVNTYRIVKAVWGEVPQATEPSPLDSKV